MNMGMCGVFDSRRIFNTLIIIISLFQIIDCDFSESVSGSKSLSKIIPHETGYETTIEIVIDGQLFAKVQEQYSTHSQEGHVKVFRVDEGKNAEFHYYLSTEELFIIKHGSKCSTIVLNSTNKHTGLHAVMDGKLNINLSSFLTSEQLGFVGLAIGLISDDQGEYVESSETPHLRKWLIYDQNQVEIKVTLYEISSYPAKSDFKFFAEMSASYSTETNGNLDQSMVLDQIRLNYAEKVFSIEFPGVDSSIKQIVDLNNDILYHIDSRTRTCTQTKKPHSSKSEGNLIGIKWPADTHEFNLLNSNLWTKDGYCKPNYFGQAMLYGRKVNIFECKICYFFNLDWTWEDEAVVTYFFDTDDKSNNQAPVKVIIQLLKNQQSRGNGKTKIEIDVIEYSENPFDDIEAFDLSACYDSDRKYSWIQFSFIDSFDRFTSMVGRGIEIEKSFRHNLHSQLKIPRIRVPEVRVILENSIVFVSVKILERPDYEFSHTIHPNSMIVNHDQVFYLNSIEDCADLCSGTEPGCDFSYCTDTRCALFTLGRDVQWPQMNFSTTECKTYSARNKINPADTKFQLMSVRRLIKHMHDNRGKMSIQAGKTLIFCDNVYQINSPTDISSNQNSLDYDSIISLEIEFALTHANRKMIDSAAFKPIKLTFVQCLEECENSDDCHSVSYCSSSNQNECSVSSKHGSELRDDDTIAFREGCDVFEKKYVSNYERVPGHSLVSDALGIYPGLSEEECAKKCSTQDTECMSFDHCDNVQHTLDDGTIRESVCYVHSFHAAKDINHELNQQIWNLSTFSCDHFSRKISQKFRQHMSTELVDKDLPIIFEGKSMENCANACLDSDCDAYEYCQGGGSQSGEIFMTCRVSVNIVSEKTSIKHSEAEDCSVSTMILLMEIISIYLFLTIVMFGCFNASPECLKKIDDQKDSPDLINIFSPKNFLVAAHIKSKNGSTDITDIYDFSRKRGFITVKNVLGPQKSTIKKIYYDSNWMITQSEECIKEKLNEDKILEVIFEEKLKDIPINSLFKEVFGPIGILHSINGKVFLAEVVDTANKTKQKWTFCGDETQNSYKITFNPEDLGRFIPGDDGKTNGNKQPESKKYLSLKITGLESKQNMNLHFFKYEPTNQDTSIPTCDAVGTNRGPGKGVDRRESKKEPRNDNSPGESKKEPSKLFSGQEPHTLGSSSDIDENNKSNRREVEKQGDTKQISSDEPSGKSFPKFVQFLPQKTESTKKSKSFKIDMKAVYMKSFQDGKRRLISQASISYADDVLVLQTISNQPSDVNRLIYDNNFNLLYSINLESRECSIEYVPLMTTAKPNLAGYRWPQSEDLFNLLNSDLWTLEPKEPKETGFLGTQKMNGNNYDVFERLISNFYVGPRNTKAKATYYFDSNEVGKPPVKVSIGPMDDEFSFYEPKIQLNIVNFTENPDDDYDRFDVSACYQNPGSYKWVQFTVDNIPPKIGMDYKKMELLFRRTLDKSLSIPRIRIGQVGINLWVPKVYIAVQLIEHPDFQFLYSIIAEKRLKQATQVYSLESVRDCADICIDSNKTCSFSYCGNKKCYIRILADNKELHRKTDLLDDKSCKTFQSLRKLENLPEDNHRLSSRTLITNIFEQREKIIFVNDGEKYKDPNMTINAINGPDDLLGPYLETPFVFLADQFGATRKGYKIRGHILERTEDKTYRRCLDACNDREDCHSISHCSNKVCILSSAQNIGDDSDTIEVDDKCSVSKRMYINRFVKIFDQKMRRKPEKTYFSVGKEECAKICSVDEPNCVSFDYCESYKKNGEKNQESCLLHNDHAKIEEVESESSIHEEDETPVCGYYSKRFSRDFIQNFGSKFNTEMSMQSKDRFQSQESCAFECFHRKCVAFEFCRKLDQKNQLPEFGCRISEIAADKKDELLKLESLEDDNDCSTFLHKNLFKVERRKSIEASSLNFAFFVSLLAILTGLGLTIFFIINRRQTEPRHIETSF
ncbi:uncharacterized protein LOC141857383 [Brevipalpus obovatus]|uniref:uncharacterized protein LOC141857383 n=1 Tax=Brevipalpus obovatus TaxID=246614 RepID=UPI003D9E26FA